MNLSKIIGPMAFVFCIIAVVLAAVIIADTSESGGSDGKKLELMNNQINEDQKTDKSPPPDEAIQSCLGKSIGNDCQFESKEGVLSGVCDNKPGILACAPDIGQNGGPVPNDKPDVQDTNTLSDTVKTKFDACINNTRDNPACKDCCDCLTDADGETRTKCRDTCALHDFSKNSDLIDVTAPSLLGPNGDYSECVEKGNSSECKSCCEESLGLQCGDYRHCRTACNNKYGDSKKPS